MAIMRIVVTQKPSGFGLISFLFLVLLAIAAGYCVYFVHSQFIWFGVVAAVVSLAGFTQSLRSDSLLLQIDESGIFDRRLGVGKILWSDVEDVQLQVNEATRFLCFRLRHPEAYVARLKGAHRERILFHHGLGFRGFNVDVGPVDVNLLDLKKFIDQRVGRSSDSTV